MLLYVEIMNTNLDVNYIVRKICDMSGVPLRLYEGNELVAFQSIVPLKHDPFTLYSNNVFEAEVPIGYFMTKEFDYYCFLRFGEKGTLVIGPSRLSDLSESEMRYLAFSLEVPNDEYDDFKQGIRSIIHMPLDSLLQIVTTLHYVLNNEKIELEDIKIIGSTQEQITNDINYDYAESRIYPSEEIAISDRYKAYQVEQLLCEYIRHGDVAGFLKWCETAPSLRTSVLSKDYLRHLKNTFIVSATLFSRAAIRGGVDAETAISLSDNYIQKCEQINTPRDITELQYNMVRRFTEQVEKLRLERIDSDLKRKVYSYVQKNISSAIRSEDIAEALFMSRSHLSTLFKKTTGINLNDYIHIIKISEAKHLLAYSDKSILLISNYLGYSSQSYFSNIFRKYTGITPKEFQNQIENKGRG